MGATKYQSKKDIIVIRSKETSCLSRQMIPAGYQAKWQTIRQKGPPDYHAKRDQLAIMAKGPPGYHGKRDQMAVSPKGPTAYQGNRVWLMIRAEGDNWPSGQLGPVGLLGLTIPRWPDNLVPYRDHRGYTSTLNHSAVEKVVNEWDVWCKWSGAGYGDIWTGHFYCWYVRRHTHGVSILECEPIDGELCVLSSNQINIAAFVHQMGDVCLPSGGKSSNIYLIWTKNTQYPIYWFASKYASSMFSA